eukprot:TRINITY_DN9368_c0_g1_i5.p2 TRINITY_DN9368_c0_g1~~TRINITY_DN9368_c0_g1_i5.p2  ORF type:complete len:217 (+),score=33.94 TRINITY_DN9368_c0_g1_i5:799-1449(+)
MFVWNICHDGCEASSKVLTTRSELCFSQCLLLLINDVLAVVYICKDACCMQALEALLDAEETLNDFGDDDLDNNGGDDGEADEKEDETDGRESKARAVKDEKPSTLPNSFSKADPSDAIAINRDFPLFKTAVQTTCEVAKGEMLYLPCGWFHEVTSFSDNSDTTADKSDKAGLHMAFNYWFHPPVPSDNTSFEQPYPTPAWENDFQRRPEAHMNSA